MREIDVADCHALMNFRSIVSLALREPKYFDDDGDLFGEKRVFPYNQCYDQRVHKDRLGQEEMSCPNSYSDGTSGEQTERKYPLTALEYYARRLCSVDKRFQRETSYVLRAVNIVQNQFMVEGMKYHSGIVVVT